jgi:hypothetical protein
MQLQGLPAAAAMLNGNPNSSSTVLKAKVVFLNSDKKSPFLPSQVTKRRKILK